MASAIVLLGHGSRDPEWARPLRELNEWLEQYRRIWDERMTQLDDLLEELKEQREPNEGGKRST